MPTAVEPSLIASMAYSTWNRRPSGEKVLTPRSYSLRVRNMTAAAGRVWEGGRGRNGCREEVAGKQPVDPPHSGMGGRQLREGGGYGVVTAVMQRWAGCKHAVPGDGSGCAATNKNSFSRKINAHQ